LRLLVATDGSEAAQHAVAWSADFARRFDADVILAHVVSNVGEWVMSVAQIDFVRVEEAHRSLLDGLWSEPLQEAGVRYRTHFTRGEPVKALLALTDAEDVDLVVIAKTGRTAAGDFLLGRSAMRLAHRCARPLILVPEPRPGLDDAPEPDRRAFETRGT
jgi:nucleotide-binding universal stress UspA family protein